MLVCAVGVVLFTVYLSVFLQLLFTLLFRGGGERKVGGREGKLWGGGGGGGGGGGE